MTGIDEAEQHLTVILEHAQEDSDLLAWARETWDALGSD